MAINSIYTLKTALNDWGDTNGSTATFADDFIALATGVFNHGSDVFAPIRVREMEAVATLTATVPGVFPLPNGLSSGKFLEVKRLAEVASWRRELTFISLTLADKEYPSRPAGVACDYTIIGSNIYTFPLTENDLELVYYQEIPLLTNAATSNWLLLKQPMLYLHALLFQQALLRRDDEMMERSAQIVNSLISGLHKSNERAIYSRAPVRMSDWNVA